MKTYNFTVTHTFSMTVSIEASSLEEAKKVLPSTVPNIEVPTSSLDLANCADYEYNLKPIKSTIKPIKIK